MIVNHIKNVQNIVSGFIFFLFIIHYEIQIKSFHIDVSALIYDFLSLLSHHRTNVLYIQTLS